MKLRIQRPRLLIAMLLLIGVLTTSALLLADGDEVIRTRFIPFPVPSPTIAPLTENQKQDMVNIVKDSGVVDSISGGQEWHTVRARWDKMEGHESASLLIEWEEPVDSSGPWAVPKCSRTRQMISKRLFSGIKQLIVTVDLENKEVLAYSVTDDGVPGEEAVMGPRNPDDSMQFYDFKTGELVFDGNPGEVPSLEKICPPGTLPEPR